jgi:glycosyltransferase involved in cell wall biosynthesis
MQDPLVSIIVPTHNRAHLIGDTIRSVISQNYRHWELIIVDDGSTDETEQVVKKFSENRIRYFFIEHTGNLGRVRNKGIAQAAGNYIALLDSDDLWLPHKLEYQLSFFTQYSQACFVFGQGEQFGEGATPTPQLERYFAGKVFHPFLFESRFILYVPTLLFKKEVFHHLKAFDESLIKCTDIDFFLRLAFRFEGVFSHEVVVRIRKAGQSHSKENELFAYEEYLKMLAKHHAEERLTDDQFRFLAAKHHYKLGLIHLRDKDSKRAASEFLKSTRLDLFNWRGWLRFIQSKMG